MSKAVVFRVIIGALTGLTMAADMLSNAETLDRNSVLRILLGVLFGYVIPYFGDTNKDGKISIADLPQEWQDVLNGLAPRPTDPPADSTGVLAVLAQQAPSNDTEAAKPDAK